MADERPQQDTVDRERVLLIASDDRTRARLEALLAAQMPEVEVTVSEAVREMADWLFPGAAAPGPLETSETRYRAVVEALHEGILVRGKDRTVVACNTAATEILGLPADRIIGSRESKNWRVLRDDGSPFPPDELPSAVTFRTGEPARAVVGLERPNGERLWLSFTSQPLLEPGATEPDAVVVSFFDVTERHEAERALEAVETRYRTLVEQMPAVTHISALDETASTIYISPQVEQLLGYTPEEWMADPELWPRLLHADDRDAALRMNRRHNEGEPLSIEYRLIHRDGREVWIREEAVVIRDDEGGGAFSQGVWLDITERKRREEEIHALNAELEARVAERTGQLEAANVNLLRAKDEAERANQAKSDFLSRMSHELRTPLNAVLGFAQLLQLTALPQGHAESVEQIVRGGRHLLELINELLDIGRIETGRLTLNVERVGLGEVVESVTELIRPVAAARQIEVGVERGTLGDDAVMADRGRLQQVLLNLLSNAVKYNREGGIVRIICTGPAHGRIWVEVRDTGIGIAPEMMDRLFTPFERLGAEQTRVEGTGLGLALARRLVEAMGGTIRAESVPGEGSTFRVELVGAAFPGTPVVERRDERVTDVVRTVLYIEDDASNLALVERLVEGRRGIRLMVAMQGGLGLDLAREHRPDVILLDVNLPDISGQEVLAQLRADPRTRDIPVLVITADATSTQMQQMLESGARAYLTKPLDVKRFLSVLDDGLSQAV
jgi:PAS domain S-box-containing protein